MVEDHLGVELEYVALITEEARRSLEDGKVEEILAKLKRNIEFLDLHLLAWTPKLFKTVEEEAREDFYRALARFAACFAASDRYVIKELIDQIQAYSPQPTL